jgi:hypothetical protein
MWTVLFADKCGTAPKPTPRPTIRPAPKPTPKPTAKPAPKATPRPPVVAPSATASALPSATSPAPLLTAAPILSPSPDEPLPYEPRQVSPTAEIGAETLRVEDRAAGRGLFDAIVGGATGVFFGTS